MFLQIDDDRSKNDAWSLGDYTGVACVNCGRDRVCECPNGKTRCEKCNWVEGDDAYCSVPIDQ